MFVLVVAFFMWILCTVYGTRKYRFQQFFFQKLSHAALFTYLKIILLLCFQFSTINSIQTDPYFLSFFGSFDFGNNPSCFVKVIRRGARYLDVL